MYKNTEKVNIPSGLSLVKDNGCLALTDGKMSLFGDYTHMIPRLHENRLYSELIVKASGIKRKISEKKSDQENEGIRPLAVDATAGLGEDSLLLAAAGYDVIMFEKDPVIAVLLGDTLKRAEDIPGLKQIISHMRLIEGDSIEGLKNADIKPDLIFLDPMFPERKKSALVRKKLQLIQKLESPCENEDEMMEAAFSASPARIIVKRPKNAPFLAARKPSHSISGKQIRYDCYVLR